MCSEGEGTALVITGREGQKIYFFGMVSVCSVCHCDKARLEKR